MIKTSLVLLGVAVVLWSWSGLAYFTPPNVVQIADYRVEQHQKPDGTVVNAIKVDNKVILLDQTLKVTANSKVRCIVFQNRVLGLWLCRPPKYEVVK